MTAHASQDYQDVREYVAHNNRMMPQLSMRRCHMNASSIQEEIFFREARELAFDFFTA